MSYSTPGEASTSHPGDITKRQSDAGILPSHGISLDLPEEEEPRPPAAIRTLSNPAYHSPLRHHRRTPSQHREVKETLNARSAYTNSEEDGKAEHHINQYIIKDEIGRGSFGAVHLAVDQYGTEYAVKEFSKARLRKRAQSNILRRPHSQRRRPGHLAAGVGLNAPLHRHSASDIHNENEQGNPLYLIKEEIAIMKKLNHPNLVSLMEVLDDPEEDSLYMVLEMCKKGVVMKVGLGERADPYDSEQCRCWFRDLILGIEYLHAQGVVHRDIKPDNLLLTDDDVLKIVDFGVSEMFEKQSEMMTAKSAGSPAFLPPELCVTKHGDISGKAADVWSMGVSLYCLRFGRIPFERSGVLELYDAIKADDPDIDSEHEPEFSDLMKRLLEKDPKKRITIPEMREHPWVNKNGTDPLLSAEENTADLVEPPSEIEVNHAITAKMRNLLVMMKAVQKFKNRVKEKRPAGLSEALHRGIRSLHPSLARSMDGASPPPLNKTRSVDLFDRQPVETVLATEGVHHEMTAPVLSSPHKETDDTPSNNEEDSTTPRPTPPNPDPTTPKLSDSRSDTGDRGHAHDPLSTPPLFLGIGPGTSSSPPSTPSSSLQAPPSDTIAASPTAAEFNIYDKAYQEEVDRIRAAQGHEATVYLTRRVDRKKEYREDGNMIKAPLAAQVRDSLPHQGFKGLLDKAREKRSGESGAQMEVGREREAEDKSDERMEEGVKEKSGMREHMQAGANRFSEMAAKAVENTKAFGKDVNERGVGDVVDGMFQKAVNGRWNATDDEAKKT